MTIEKLERVMWRLRKNNPNIETPTCIELKKAIMQEIGTDPRTYNTNRRALTRLRWIKAYGRTRVQITNRDLTDG